jgi:hypothetical protein
MNRLAELLRLTPLAIKLRNCQFTARSCASTRLRDSTLWDHLSQTNLIVRYRSHPAETDLLTQRKLTCVNAEVSFGVPQFPIWG